MAHIGDGHDQTPATAGATLYIDRIVEITSGFIIDGNQRQITQIHPVGLGLMGHLVTEFFGGGFDAFRPDMGNLEAAQRHLHFHPGFIRGGNNLFQTHQYMVVAAGVLGNSGTDMIARVGLDAVLVLDQDFFGDPAVFRLDKADPGFPGIATHHFRGHALGDFDDAGLFLAEAVIAGIADQHPVAVHDVFHLPGGEKQVTLGLVVRNKEAKAIFMALHPASDQVHLGHHANLAVAVLNQLGITEHGLDTAIKPDLPLFIHFQQLSQQLKRQGFALIIEHIQNQLPAGNRVLVFFRLSVGMGIAIAFF